MAVVPMTRKGASAPNPVTVEELARQACLAWADGDDDEMQDALLGLFLHLFGRAPEVRP